MKDLNKVIIIGRLGRDPELRFTPKGEAVTTFRVAANRQWRDHDGSLRESTEWFRIVTRGNLAVECHTILQRGMRVYVEGRLQTRRWNDNNIGVERVSVEVVAHDVIFLSSSAQGERQSAAYSSSYGDDMLEPYDSDDLPF